MNNRNKEEEEKIGLRDSASLLPVWGKVFFTNTKRAFPGGKLSLELKIWMKWPTDKSRGTRYLSQI